jgi:hypothetical protein
MSNYREKLWPSAWVYLSTALVIPASLLVFLPINLTAGVVAGIVLYAACLLVFQLTTPLIEVTSTEFVAGKARLPMAIIGETAAVVLPEEATAERGVRLDARAWLLIRGWITPVVKLEVLDPLDPVPYWLVSTRHPDAIVAAISTAKERASS